jgi:hypothetical protein
MDVRSPSLSDFFQPSNSAGKLPPPAAEVELVVSLVGSLVDDSEVEVSLVGSDVDEDSVDEEVDDEELVVGLSSLLLRARKMPPMQQSSRTSATPPAIPRIRPVRGPFLGGPPPGPPKPPGGGPPGPPGPPKPPGGGPPGPGWP